MATTNRNAARKIAAAIQRGWTPDLYPGPCRFLRLSKAQRRMAFKHARNSVDNRWRGVPNGLQSADDTAQLATVH